MFIIAQIFEIFSGDVEGIHDFVKALDRLKAEPIPVESEETAIRGIYKILIDNFVLLYRVNHKSKVITILSIGPL